MNTSSDKVSVVRPALRQVTTLLLAAAILAWATAFWEIQWHRPPEIRSISIAAARKDAANLVWVDVRTRDRFDISHISDAILFDENAHNPSLENLMQQWNPKRRVVVYGEGAGSDRAQRVAIQLKKDLQTRHIYLLEGGWATWPRE